MAIYGFGCNYEENVMDKFIEHGMACVGWSEDESPTLHQILRGIKVGDIVFLKSFPPSHGLYVKAIGIVIGGYSEEHKDNLGCGVSVKWMWDESEPMVIGRVNDKYDQVRGGTLYEEYNPEVCRQLIGKLCERLGE